MYRHDGHKRCSALVSLVNKTDLNIGIFTEIQVTTEVMFCTSKCAQLLLMVLTTYATERQIFCINGSITLSSFTRIYTIKA